MGHLYALVENGPSAYRILTNWSEIAHEKTFLRRVLTDDEPTEKGRRYM